MPSEWDVHKFGGTSVGSCECMLRCVEIVRARTGRGRLAVVVSAMGGKPKVTDMLLDCVHASAAADGVLAEAKLSAIYAKHRTCVGEILCAAAAARILEQIESDIQDIRDLLKAVSLMRVAHEQILELVSGYGEVWSATVMSEALCERGLPFVFLNARDVLLVSEDELGTKVHWEESTTRLHAWIAAADERACSEGAPPPHLLVTGYVASTLQGVATTLKRDGSDFSASIFGKMLLSRGITIWTDVSGVYSADPRRVPDAQIIPFVSYTEAIELAYFGAKVIHPKTMSPAIDAQIPIYIRNTFEPENPGTRIFLPPAKGEVVREKCVCGFSTVDGISLINVEGSGMIGVPGIAHRLFGALKSASVSVMFIAQASSEHSICFAVKQSFCAVAKSAVEEAFFYELKIGLVSSVKVIDDCSIIAAVGESMGNMPGVSGIFFAALGNASVNVLSISQGCDERNISAVVYAKDSGKALRAVHSAFWLSTQHISVGIVGTGRVGCALLQAVTEQVHMLQERFGLTVSVRGIANSSQMLLDEDLVAHMQRSAPPEPAAFEPRSLRRAPSRSIAQDTFELLDLLLSGDAPPVTRRPADLSAFVEHVKGGPSPHSIVIDCSNSSAVAELHPYWLSRGCHVVTANKRALAEELALYNRVFAAVRAHNRMYMSEVTIGASIPVITTLSDLLCSGDQVHSIVGLVSASAGKVLTDICDGGFSFTKAVSRTFSMGLFEDDVFKDLEGTEAAQKLLILARELGVPMRLSDVNIEPIARRRALEGWDSMGDAFAEEDALYARRAATAASRGCTLRYVQRIDCTPAAALGGKRKIHAVASVKLEEVPLDSPLAMVKGALYYFAFHTERYNRNPLTVQGPLSDSANAASGIVGDILRVARSLGVKDRGQGALGVIDLLDRSEHMPAAAALEV